MSRLPAEDRAPAKKEKRLTIKRSAALKFCRKRAWDAVCSLRKEYMGDGLLRVAAI